MAETGSILCLVIITLLRMFWFFFLFWFRVLVGVCVFVVDSWRSLVHEKDIDCFFAHDPCFWLQMILCHFSILQRSWRVIYYWVT